LRLDYAPRGTYLQKPGLAENGLAPLGFGVCSIVISGLQEINCFIGDPINQSVFLSDTSGPTAAEHIFQWLGFSRAFERISHDCINKVEDPQRDRALVLNPEPEILKKLNLKYREAFNLSLHLASLSSRLMSPEV
jgi:hypothetical protein